MTADMIRLNLTIAWLWVTLGFGSGLLLGMNFHKENWLGGYGSYRRRMYRLGHIAFFGLAMVNLMFYVTARGWDGGAGVAIASRMFVVGAVSMPLCCVIMAQSPKWRWLFALPVVSLIVGAGLTFWKVLHL